MVYIIIFSHPIEGNNHIKEILITSDGNKHSKFVLNAIKNIFDYYNINNRIVENYEPFDFFVYTTETNNSIIPSNLTNFTNFGIENLLLRYLYNLSWFEDIMSKLIGNNISLADFIEFADNYIHMYNTIDLEINIVQIYEHYYANENVIFQPNDNQINYKEFFLSSFSNLTNNIDILINNIENYDPMQNHKLGFIDLFTQGLLIEKDHELFSGIINKYETSDWYNQIYPELQSTIPSGKHKIWVNNNLQYEFDGIMYNYSIEDIIFTLQISQWSTNGVLKEFFNRIQQYEIDRNEQSITIYLSESRVDDPYKLASIHPVPISLNRTLQLDVDSTYPIYYTPLSNTYSVLDSVEWRYYEKRIPNNGLYDIIHREIYDEKIIYHLKLKEINEDVVFSLNDTTNLNLIQELRLHIPIGELNDGFITQDIDVVIDTEDNYDNLNLVNYDKKKYIGFSSVKIIANASDSNSFNNDSLRSAVFDIIAQEELEAILSHIGKVTQSYFPLHTILGEHRKRIMKTLNPLEILSEYLDDNYVNLVNEIYLLNTIYTGKYIILVCSVLIISIASRRYYQRLRKN
ncbi:MAG: hypothetical protein OEY49_10610 [Candidatus Heimdallarchaeota archaeon]|nr:hypothetical protein [Candidatus Heimdallarchaeota archaeon]